MFVIRPITSENAKVIERFMTSDLLGITSLPRSKHLLYQKLMTSITSFSKELTSPQNEQYYFVLENMQTGEIGGICGIESKTGVDHPIYSLKVEKVLAPETDLPVPRKQLILHLQVRDNGPTEIGSLYILPSFRKEGLGRLLSLSRFLFMASFPERFDTKVVAEMRGFIDNKKCPFWEGLGRHFVDMEFEELMNMLDEIKESIPLIAPKYPVYVSLLNSEAQDAIGRVHQDTQPALNLLMQEGFTLTDEIDLFDAGPKIEADVAEVRTVKQSRLAWVHEVSQAPIESDRYMIGNNRINHFACYGHISFIDENSVAITADVAQALGVGRDDQIRYVLASTKLSSKETG